MTSTGERMAAVILAGGLATRLGPLAANTPKSLIEVAGKPFLWHQLALLKHHGIRRAILCAGHLGEMIQERCGDGAQLGVRLEYSFDYPRLLGTAGAIRQALPRLPERFFVLYGDSYLTCDYGAIEDALLASGQPAVMTVYRNEGRYDTSNVEYREGRIFRYDKHNRTPAMQHIDYGLGAFEREVFAALPGGEVRDLAAVYQELLGAGRLHAVEVRERFYEIGSPEGLRETADLLARPASH